MAFPLTDAEHAAIKARIDGQVELIVTAAIEIELHGAKIILTSERPGRHGDVIHLAGSITGDRMRGGEHGFLTNRGRFVDRAEAARIVVAAGQTTPRPEMAHLFSEDVWNDWDVRPTARIEPEDVF